MYDYIFFTLISNMLFLKFIQSFLTFLFIIDDYDGYPPHGVYRRSSFSTNTNGTISLHKPKRSKSGKKHFLRSCRLL